MVFLCETRLKVHEMKGVKRKLHFLKMVVVSCEGEGRQRSEELALLWQDSLSLHMKSFSINHIDVIVHQEGWNEWRYTGIYGHLQDENKHKIGELLERLAHEADGPWVCMADFNLLMSSNEKKGGSAFDVNKADIFRREWKNAAF